MPGGLYRYLATGTAILALSALPGCVQATRHSNTMLFGTNTSFGIKAGTTTGQVPQVSIGYDRQEAVIMPLVANTASVENPNLLKPCDLQDDVTTSGNKAYVVHPCLLVAVNGKALDSYSVLASFGASYDASGSGAKGGLAQYFATGIAAQVLAATGGAAVVATGSAAAISAAKAPPAEETIDTLYGDSPAFQMGIGRGNRFNAFAVRLKVLIAQTPEADLKAAMTKFEAAAKPTAPIASRCDKPQPCVDAVHGYTLDYSIRPKDFDDALEAWSK